jgi:hypothetical protein
MMNVTLLELMITFRISLSLPAGRCTGCAEANATRRGSRKHAVEMIRCGIASPLGFSLFRSVKNERYAARAIGGMSGPNIVAQTV